MSQFPFTEDWKFPTGSGSKSHSQAWTWKGSTNVGHNQRYAGERTCKTKMRNLLQGPPSLLTENTSCLTDTQHSSPGLSCLSHAGEHGAPDPSGGAHHVCISSPVRTPLCSPACTLVLWSSVILHINGNSMAWSRGPPLGHGKPEPIRRGAISHGSIVKRLNLVTIRNEELKG